MSKRAADLQAGDIISKGTVHSVRPAADAQHVLVLLQGRPNFLLMRRADAVTTF